ncbi:MAG: class I SAM-dependent RNA methyltransferase [Metamycoplasmataceae bacterium]
MKKETLIIEKYNHNGEGIAFWNKKPVYIFGSIIGETIEVDIIEEKNTYSIGKINKIIHNSPNRRKEFFKDQELIGGYELIHMNQEEQTNFKINKIKEAFKQNANFILSNIEKYIPQKEFYYRNKIILHDGYFYSKKTNEKIEIKDFKLSKIKPETSLKGEVIIREIDNQKIEGKIGEKKFQFINLNDFKIRLSISSFFQVNDEVANEIYKNISLEIQKESIVFDLYSGIGIFALLASRKAKEVYSVENNNFSHNDAKWNIKNNNIKNITIIKQDVMHFLLETDIKANIVILDPTRSGLNKKICKLINEKIKPEKIIYLSCNVSTQARDFSYFKDFYEISKIKMFDMFPQTNHLENLIILKRKIN